MLHLDPVGIFIFFLVFLCYRQLSALIGLSLNLWRWLRTPSLSFLYIGNPLVFFLGAVLPKKCL